MPSFIFFKMFKLMDLDGDKHFSKDDLSQLGEAGQVGIRLERYSFLFE